MRNIGFALLALLVIGIAWQIVETQIISSHETQDSAMFLDKVPDRYVQLFHLNDTLNGQHNKIKFFRTTVFKYRHPWVTFFIDNKYYLQACLLDSLCNYSLIDSLRENFHRSSSVAMMTPYASDESTDMKFNIHAIKPSKRRSIILNLFGDSTLMLKRSDKIAYFYSKCENFSINYQSVAAPDIVGETRNKAGQEVPVEVLFLIKGRNLFLLLLSSTYANIQLPKNMLCKTMATMPKS